MQDLQRLQIAVIQYNIGIHTQAELDLEIVERLFVIAHRVDPAALGGKHLLLQTPEIGLSDAAFLRERPAALRILLRTLQVQEAVAHGVAITQNAIIRSGNLHAEILPVSSEVPQIVQYLP